MIREVYDYCLWSDKWVMHYLQYTIKPTALFVYSGKVPFFTVVWLKRFWVHFMTRWAADCAIYFRFIISSLALCSQYYSYVYLPLTRLTRQHQRSYTIILYSFKWFILNILTRLSFCLHLSSSSSSDLSWQS